MASAATVLVCALSVLGRSADTFPPIVFVEAVPPHGSRTAEAFVVTGSDIIYIVTTSPAFLAARSAGAPCRSVAPLRKMASILVHEEWHVRNGSDERGAYEAQLMALARMGSGPGTRLYADVRRAMQAVLAARGAPRQPDSDARSAIAAADGQRAAQSGC